MKLLVAAGAALTAVALAGCGTTSSSTHAVPDVAGKPTWGGCRNLVSQVADYSPDAKGSRTRTAALAQYRQEGDHTVFRPARNHRAGGWLLVDDQNVIHASVGLFHGHGWLASSVETCAD